MQFMHIEIQPAFQAVELILFESVIYSNGLTLPGREISSITLIVTPLSIDLVGSGYLESV